MKIVLLLTCFLVAIAFAASPRVCKTYTSADLLYSMGPLSNKTASPTPYNCWVGMCEAYIWGTWITKATTSVYTCLGWNGPLGAMGPLSAIGPLGDNKPSPAEVMKSIGNWEEFKNVIMRGDGPLEQAKSPLSQVGPLGGSFFTLMPKINDFTMHMQGQGIWSVLGPIGPLGALGPLGPVGPLGAHGFGQNDGGDYIDATGKVVRTVRANWGPTSGKNGKDQFLEWPLYEKYTQERAELMTPDEADTSFMVVADTPSTYYATSRERQYVTILVVPHVYTHQFFIEVRSQGQVIAKSANQSLMNWVQLYIDEDAAKQLEIRVTASIWNNIFFGSAYNLYVVGSTKQMMRQPHIAYRGDYIAQC